LFGAWSQFFFLQAGYAEMLAEAFDGVFCGLVIDSNGKYRIDEAERQVVVTILFCLNKIGKVEIGFARCYKISNFFFG